MCVRIMTANAYLDLKQKLARLSERERRDISIFLIRIGQESPAWRKETARRLKAMAMGRQTSVAALRRQLGHA